MISQYVSDVVYQGKYSDADPLFRRALSIKEKALGHDHPSTITARAWIGDNLQKKGDYDGALPILREVAESNERVLGKEHPEVAKSLSNLALLLSAQVHISSMYVADVAAFRANIHKRNLCMSGQSRSATEPLASTILIWRQGSTILPCCCGK